MNILKCARTVSVTALLATALVRPAAAQSAKRCTSRVRDFSRISSEGPCIACSRQRLQSRGRRASQIRYVLASPAARIWIPATSEA